jgi:hypothetical protein
MTKLSWSLSDDLDNFEMNGSEVNASMWNNQQALYLDNEIGIGTSVLLKEDVNYDNYRLEVEIACPGTIGFIGLIFGAHDASNYELVYVSPGSNTALGEIQYDPIMNGSSTWQIYQGPKYQAPAPFLQGEWTKFSLIVHPNTAAIYVGDTETPQLVISNLQHGRSKGKIGVWGYLPCYIRNLSVEQIHSTSMNRSSTDLKQLAAETFVTEWRVSRPYIKDAHVEASDNWVVANVEENGTLNLNRLFTSEKNTSVQVQSMFTIPEEIESLLTFGFSDHLRLWVNDDEVYLGEWKWDPPGSDGRIRYDYASVLIHWKTGFNTIRAEVTSQEVVFGWGLCVKTGLFNMNKKQAPL